MIKQHLFILMLLCSVCCCSPKEDGLVSEIVVNNNKVIITNVNRLKADTTAIPLSSLVEDYNLVQLEYTEEALINPSWTTITEKYIGVLQANESYKLFDRSGKFLCSVGSVGQGPGEYSTLYDDFIDDANELIFLTPFIGNKIFIYNTSGVFLKEIVATQRLVNTRVFLSEEILTVIHMPDTNDKAMITQFDVNTGLVLNETIAPANVFENSYEYGIYNSRNISDTFDFIHTSNDTLYHFDVKNNLIKPVFTLKHNTSDETTLQHYLCQLNKDLIMSFVFNKGLILTDINSKRASWVKLKNDYFGNMEIPASIVNFRNGYYVHNIQPEQLMDDIEQRLSESTCPEKDKQMLHKTLLTLKKGENNVVLVGKLKKSVSKFIGG